jgi:hypothetical protein
MCFAGFLLPFTQPAQGSLIDNGGFETGDFTGWVESGNVTIGISGGDPCCEPSEGQYYVDFNGGDVTPNGIISQTFTTVAGNTYDLWLDFGKGGTGTGIASLGVQTLGLQTLLDEVVSDSTGGDPG